MTEARGDPSKSKLNLKIKMFGITSRAVNGVCYARCKYTSLGRGGFC